MFLRFLLGYLSDINLLTSLILQFITETAALLSILSICYFLIAMIMRITRFVGWTWNICNCCHWTRPNATWPCNNQTALLEKIDIFKCSQAYRQVSSSQQSKAFGIYLPCFKSWYKTWQPIYWDLFCSSYKYRPITGHQRHRHLKSKSMSSGSAVSKA